MSELYKTIPVVLPAIWDELPEFFGDEWLQVQPKIWELLRQLEAGVPEAAKKIVEIIATIPAAYERFQAVAESSVAKGAAPAGTVAMHRYVEVPVMYGTNRQRDADDYTGDANESGLVLGEAWVSIPEDHRMGKLEHPPKWMFGFGWDPKKHMTLLRFDELKHDAFISNARQMIAEGAENEALVFIHGFNVGFADAARRAAQLAYDLRFKGLTMLYSWPSKGQLSRQAYMADGDLANNARPMLKQFLADVIGDLGVDGVHVIAHSMGNRLLTEVLKEMALAPPAKRVPLRQVVFAAPDVNADTFKTLAAEFHRGMERCTLYANSKDRALQLSREFNSTARAGNSGARLTVVEGVDTIDVTGVDTSFLGHSVYSDNRTLLADLELLIREESPPEDRPLLDAIPLPSGKYWKFRQ